MALNTEVKGKSGLYHVTRAVTLKMMEQSCPVGHNLPTTMEGQTDTHSFYVTLDMIHRVHAQICQLPQQLLIAEWKTPNAHRAQNPYYSLDSWCCIKPRVSCILTQASISQNSPGGSPPCATPVPGPLWSLQEPGTYVVHRHMQAKHSQHVKINFFFQE